MTTTPPQHHEQVDLVIRSFLRLAKPLQSARVWILVPTVSVKYIGTLGPRSIQPFVAVARRL